VTSGETIERSTTTSTRARHAALGAIALGAIGVFAAVQRTIHPLRGNRFDRALLRSAGRMRSPWMNLVFKSVTAIGGVPGAVFIAVGSVVLARKNKRAAFQLGIGALGGVGAEFGLKQAFGRARPTQLPHLERVTSKSFPSGHAMASAALWLSLAFVGSRRNPAQRGPMFVGAGAMAGSIGLSRIYLGVHWPTDVVGGLALGTAWASAVEAALDWVTLSRGPERT
jgi:undecaprenyl-diphosphatase